ncbi:MAG TPA: PAS domain-containing protein [Stellaceae bacterium]|nr:PAS domain-containing protein [Stellaceae bacterium]
MQTDSDFDLDTTGWNPRLRRLYDYWRAIRPAGGLLPGRRHFDPIDVPELLPGIWLLDVHREPFRLRYRLAGTGIVAAIGHEVTGLWLDEAHPGIMENRTFVERYRHVVERGLPDRRKGKPRLWVHRDFDQIENLLLPLAQDGRRVDMICAYSLLFRPNGSTAY